MRLLLIMGVLLTSLSLFAQVDPEKATNNAKFDIELGRARELFTQGKYGATRESLNALEETLKSGEGNKTLIGLVSYWTGVTANRQQEFAQSITAFEQALAVDYRPKDIYYEYGQALFAADKLTEARNAFSESLKRGHKRGVSLYYIGFISQNLRDYKRAVTFYRAIQSLPLAEQEDTVQAAEMQVGDIYLEQAEKHPDAFKAVENYVIPQYKKAVEVAPESTLAGDIKQRIVGLQQKYELVLFRMRNGRPTSIPPYFLRFMQDLTYDTNPVFAAQETTNSEAKQGSMLSKSEAFGRYTFYHKNIISISPEMRMNYTRHLKREEEIYRNDNWVMAPAIRTAFEHSFGKKPGSFLVDYDFVYSQRDRDAEEDLKFNARTSTFTVGERISGLLGRGDTTVRLRRRSFDSFNASSDSKTNGLALEQVVPTDSGRLWIFNLGYDQTRVEDDIFDTNTMFLRTDLIFPAWKSWQITPQVGFSLTLTDPINNNDRGNENTINPSLRFSKPLWKRYRLSFHADYMKNKSKDEANFAYQKTFYGFEFEYIF